MDLQKRIEQLEKERWLYVMLGVFGALAGLAGAGVAVLKSGGSSGGVINASQISLTDSKGLLRARLAVDSQGLAALSFYDEKLKPLQLIGLSKTGEGQLLTYNGDGKPQIELRVTNTGKPRFGLYDMQGNARAMLALDNDPNFELRTSDGKKAVALHGAATGQISVTDTKTGAGQSLTTTGVKPVAAVAPTK